MVTTPTVPAVATPHAANPTLVLLDTIVHDAVSVETLIAGLVLAFLPMAGPFIPEVEAILAAIANALDKAIGKTS